jgi:hypothetical protein
LKEEISNNKLDIRNNLLKEKTLFDLLGSIDENILQMSNNLNQEASYQSLSNIENGVSKSLNQISGLSSYFGSEFSKFFGNLSGMSSEMKNISNKISDLSKQISGISCDLPNNQLNEPDSCLIKVFARIAGTMTPSWFINKDANDGEIGSAIFIDPHKKRLIASYNETDQIQDIQIAQNNAYKYITDLNNWMNFC